MARPVYEAILLDAQTGQVLGEVNANFPTPPASLTKMMTLYLCFEALKEGRLRLDQSLPVSDYAAGRAPSKLGLKPGDAISVHDLILGVVTKSANDAAVVLAEALGGSEADFAQQMNSKARQLGMNATVYDNASGLPDPNQRTTARNSPWRSTSSSQTNADFSRRASSCSGDSSCATIIICWIRFLGSTGLRPDS